MRIYLPASARETGLKKTEARHLGSSQMDYWARNGQPTIIDERNSNIAPVPLRHFQRSLSIINEDAVLDQLGEFSNPEMVEAYLAIGQAKK